MFHRRSAHLSDEQLSLLLDGRLSEKERRRAMAHLQACARCKEAYEGLQQTVALLRAAPRVRVPRAFTLTEADVGRVPARGSSPAWTRWATALVGLALVLVLGLDFSLSLLAPLSAPPPEPAKAVVTTMEVQALPQPKAVEQVEKPVPPVSEKQPEEKEAPPLPAARASIPTMEVGEVTREALVLPTVQATRPAVTKTPEAIPTPMSERKRLPILASPRGWLRVAEIILGALLVVLFISARKARG